MSKNIIYSALGVILGFSVGFFIANAGGKPRPLAKASANSSRPSDQTQADGQLPPNHPNVAGNAASSSQQAQAAMDAADRNPQDFKAQLLAAATFYQLDAMDKAKFYLQRALALKPDDPDALTGMGHTLYDAGDFVGAATYYEKVLAQQPSDADLRADLGSTYARRTPPDYDRAIAEYRKALAVDPKHEQALARLADAQLEKGDKTAARETIDKLASVNPSSPALSTLRSNLNGK